MMASALPPSEGVLRLTADLSLAYVRHSPAAAPAALRVLCAHGWVDNAASFALLAPALATRLRADVVCLDLAGHGRSGHRAPSAVYSALHYAADVVRAAEELGWWSAAAGAPEEGGGAPQAPLVLVGHSMGAGLVSAVAGAFPERVAALVMLDGLGLVTRAPAEAPATFRAACVALRELQRSRGGGGGGGGGGGYSSVADAVDQRLATVARHPGSQTLSRAAAEALVLRALDELPPPAPAEGAAAPSPPPQQQQQQQLSPPSRFVFRHDRRIMAPSLLSATEDIALAFLRGVRCPTLYVSARNGWPFAASALQERLAALGGAAQLAHEHLAGSHHLHLDADTGPAVAAAVVDFLTRARATSAA
jgi:pimeloyl-ACP methyl ester carboxylesterase